MNFNDNSAITSIIMSLFIIGTSLTIFFGLMEIHYWYGQNYTNHVGYEWDYWNPILMAPFGFLSVALSIIVLMTPMERIIYNYISSTREASKQ